MEGYLFNLHLLVFLSHFLLHRRLFITLLFIEILLGCKLNYRQVKKVKDESLNGADTLFFDSSDFPIRKLVTGLIEVAFGLCGHHWVSS